MVLDSLDGFTGQTFSEVDAAVFQALGLNVIRLGVMWPGVQPAAGVWDDAYLGAMKHLVDTAANFGIYTLVEFHQDVLSVCV